MGGLTFIGIEAIADDLSPISPPMSYRPARWRWQFVPLPVRCVGFAEFLPLIPVDVPHVISVTESALQGVGHLEMVR